MLDQNKAGAALTELADIAICVSNCMHQLHLNVRGPEFDIIHAKITKKYYEEAANDYDSWAEASQMYVKSQPNANESAKRINWPFMYEVVPTDKQFVVQSVEEMLQLYCDKLAAVYNAFNKEEDARAIAVVDAVQPRVGYWTKELYFFNARRS